MADVGACVAGLRPAGGSALRGPRQHPLDPEPRASHGVAKDGRQGLGGHVLVRHEHARVLVGAPCLAAEGGGCLQGGSPRERPGRVRQGEGPPGGAGGVQLPGVDAGQRMGHPPPRRVPGDLRRLRGKEGGNQGQGACQQVDLPRQILNVCKLSS
ncbi:hypothetical protein T484DRAFT_3584306 [Baffinella frigidus]|nr:hypothetical protein T484DRAFT_3584306 [Cryptophyta sp. CCMP2293]